MYARKPILLSISVVTLLFFSCQEKKADFFERDAKEYTATYCPQPLGDGVTTLDSIVFDKEGVGTLKIYYSLVLTDEERENMMNKLGELGDANLSTLRSSVILAKHKEAGVNFNYIYIDKNRKEKIAEYNFTKEDYK